MIDEEWLAGLRVAMPDGCIDGLLGVGSEYVTFSMNALDGTQHALSFWRNHLGFHIREISHLITNTPDYDLDRLNGKLRQLVGSPAPGGRRRRSGRGVSGRR